MDNEEENGLKFIRLGYKTDNINLNVFLTLTTGMMTWNLVWSELPQIRGRGGWVTKFNTLRPRQNYPHFGNDNFKCIFMNENVWILHLRFHWSLFLRHELSIFQHWSRRWLGTDQATTHYLNQCCWLVYWHIYESLYLNELTFFGQLTVRSDQG